jgi:hypothetical protein
VLFSFERTDAFHEICDEATCEKRIATGVRKIYNQPKLGSSIVVLLITYWYKGKKKIGASLIAQTSSPVTKDYKRESGHFLLSSNYT